MLLKALQFNDILSLSWLWYPGGNFTPAMLPCQALRVGSCQSAAAYNHSTVYFPNLHLVADDNAPEC
jgi:hypothetical protein